MAESAFVDPFARLASDHLSASPNLAVSPSPIHWLDFGCGAGGFLKYLRERAEFHGRPLALTGHDVGSYADLLARKDGFRILDAKPFFEWMLHRNAVFLGAMIVKREVFEAVGPFDETLCGAADWNLCLRIAHRHTFGFWNDSLAVYTKHEGGMSNDTDGMCREFCMALKNLRGQSKLDLIRSTTCCACSDLGDGHSRICSIKCLRCPRRRSPNDSGKIGARTMLLAEKASG